MKLCFLTRSYDHGIWWLESHSKILIEHLINQGHQITVVTPACDSPVFKIPEVAIVRLKPAKTKYGWAMLKEFKGFVEWNKHYDLYINIGFSVRLISSKVLKSLPLITIMHGSYTIESKTYKNLFFLNYNPLHLLKMLVCWLFYLLLERSVVKNSHKVVAISSYVARMLQKYHALKSWKLVTITNGVKINGDVIEKSYTTPYKMFFLWRLHYTKWIKFLLSFIQKNYEFLNKYFSEITFFWLGDQLQYIQQFSNDYPLVKYGGVLKEDKYFYMQDYHFSIFPFFTNESFWLSLVESMTCWVIPVSTSFDWVYDIINHQEDGFIFSMWKEDSLRNTLEKIVKQDQSSLEKISLAWKNKVVQQFSQNEMLNAYQQLIESYSSA